jgi:MinD-like ATPase involved in chromosome partitioning or flagellar assembly
MALRFDESLHEFAAALSDEFGIAAVQEGRIIRDAFGRLTFISKVELEEATLKAATKHLIERMGPYVDPERVILTPDYPGMSDILAAEGLQIQTVAADGTVFSIHLLDRRIVGSDWLTRPSGQKLNAPTMVFASLKGGVGRSTAICVLAKHLSTLGKNVLTVDLDLEAPGLGSMLLHEDRRPVYGLLDLLVEEGVSELDDELLDNCVGISGLVEGKGLIEVLPATGNKCRLWPENVLAKLSRAMIEAPQPAATAKPVRDRIRAILETITSRRKYDAILIDSRAGLAEISATSMLGLGGDVLLFGVDQPQTFEDFSYVLAHLATLPFQAGEVDWRARMKVIHAKARSTSEALREFQDKTYEVFADDFYEADTKEEAFVFSVEDELAPHFAIPIYMDSTFSDFDPVGDTKFLELSVYRAAFGDFLSFATSRLGFEESAD